MTRQQIDKAELHRRYNQAEQMLRQATTEAEDQYLQDRDWDARAIKLNAALDQWDATRKAAWAEYQGQ